MKSIIDMLRGDKMDHIRTCSTKTREVKNNIEGKWKETNNKCNKQITVTNIYININPTISIIILNMNSQNVPNKKKTEIVRVDLKKNTHTNICCLHTTDLKYKDSYRLLQGWRMIQVYLGDIVDSVQTTTIKQLVIFLLEEGLFFYL